MAQPTQPSPPPVGPDPVTEPASFNPYTMDGKSVNLGVASPSPLTVHTLPSAPGYEVHPNPIVLSHPSTPAALVDHGPAVAHRTVGSQRLYLLLAYGFELLKGLLLVILLGILFQLFVVTVFHISGESMLPSFADGQFIVVDKLSYLIHAPARGDVVVIQFPGDPDHRRFIKRVIGLPGEKVEVSGGRVTVDDRLLQEPYLPAGLQSAPDGVKVLRSDEFFVMGDNRPNSNDSRFFGPVPRDKFIGKSQAILSGKAFGWVAQPAF